MELKALIEELRSTVEGDDAARKFYLMQQAADRLDRMSDALVKTTIWTYPYRGDTTRRLISDIYQLAYDAMQPKAEDAARDARIAEADDGEIGAGLMARDPDLSDYESNRS